VLRIKAFETKSSSLAGGAGRVLVLGRRRSLLVESFVLVPVRGRAHRPHIDDDTGSIDLDDVVALLVCDDVGAQLAVTVIAGARQRHDVVVVALDSAPAVRADVRLPSTAELDDLLKAVRSTATTGATAYAAVPSQAPAGVVGTARLTSREAEVVALLMEGTRSARIADELGISVNTVRSHVQNIMSKPGVNSRLEVAGVVAQNGSGGVAAGLGVR
jgi:DNA-binding CsgD family transcriptional regulator